MNKNVLRKIIILLTAPVIGLVLLLLVHLLPNGKMYEHVYWSIDTVTAEFEDETLVDGYKATLTGNFTDCLMILHAVYDHPGHSVLEQSLLMYRPEYLISDDPEAWQPGNSLVDYIVNGNINREVTYGRYWHGYLVFLKPLLMITSLGSVRLFFAAFQLLLLGLVVIELASKGMKKAAWAFILSMPYLFFFSTFASLSLSICFFLMIFAMYVLIRFWDVLEDKKLFFEAFLIFGILTSYFDFLTYPLVTLGFPLVFYAYRKAGNEYGKKNLLSVVCNSFAWFAGYGFMWMSKWLIAAVFGYKGLIGDAFSTVGTRVGSAESLNRIGGFFRVIGLNLKPYLNWGFFIYIIIVLAACVIGFICKKKKAMDLKSISDKVKSGWILLFIALYPFFWFIALENHSEQHWIYTCRIFAVTFYAVSSFLVYLTEDGAK